MRDMEMPSRHGWPLDDDEAHEIRASEYASVVDCLDRLGGRIDDYTCYEAVSETEEAELLRIAAMQPEKSTINAHVAHISRWGSFLYKVQAAVNRSDDGAALVSLVFCHPTSIVFRDLKRTFAYLNLRSGSAWDLHFVGYRPLLSRIPVPSVLGVSQWRFDSAYFLGMTGKVEHLHAKACVGDFEDLTPWHFSGTADLVSVMAYRDVPGMIDWPSLRAVRLLDANGQYVERSLGSVVEVMSDWRKDGSELRDIAPGELRNDGFSVASIEPAVRAVAGTLIGGVAGNAAYELLKQIIGD